MIAVGSSNPGEPGRERVGRDADRGGAGLAALEDAVREIIRHRIVANFPPQGKAPAKAGRIPVPAMVIGAVLALGLIFATRGLILIPVILAGAVLAIRRDKISKIPGLAIAAVLIALTATLSAAAWSSGSSSAQVASQAPATSASASQAPVTHAPATHAPASTPSPSIRTTFKYSSAQQLVVALRRGGLPCTGGNYSTPVVSGATSETLCELSSSEQTLIDVFPRTVSKAMVLKNSVSTGTEQIFSVVGQNWWVQVSHAYASRVKSILGGRIIAGPWHQSAPSPSPTITHSAAPPPAPTTSAAAPPPASCYPLTNGGNCYEPGEYCRNSDHGMYGAAGDGEKIICEDNNGWRWEPV
jgi:hypothetical protein